MSAPVVGCLMALVACGPSNPSSTKATNVAKGSDMTEVSCEEVREAIAARRYVGWRGLPTECAPEVVFGVPLDDSWSVLPLGEKRQPARSRLLELPGYYRPLAYVRDGAPVAFDAMNPQLEGDARALAESLGTLFLNPETQAVVYVTV